MLNISKNTARGFTIVELLIVVVVIAILAAITIVSYNGISRRSEISALQSGLRQTATKLNTLKVDNNDAYPTTLPAGMPSSGSTYDLTYSRSDALSFCVTAVSKKTTSLVYRISQSGTLEEGYCPGHSPLDITAEACFNFTPATNTITDYYDNESNNAANPACPRIVRIPSQIGGVTVTTIGNAALNTNQLTSVVIPNTVTTIASAAFISNQLTSIVIPNSVTTIGPYAFQVNQLKSVTLSNSLTSIGFNAFYQNQIESLTIPNSVTTIGNMAFAQNKLASIVIPDSVTSIGENVFWQNSLTSVSIGAGITVIPRDAFANNQITSLVIPNGVTTIGERAFYVNKITSLARIPTSVTSIGPAAFLNNYDLIGQTIEIPTATTIGSSAFDYTPVIVRY